MRTCGPRTLTRSASKGESQSTSQLASDPTANDNRCMTTFHTSRRVEFCETDAAGIAHFSAFFLYMEQAEHACLRDLGLSVMHHDADGTISWPRVSATCDFGGTVKFEDIVDIEVGIERLGEKSVTYVFRFALAGREVATGNIIAVCCRIRPDAPPQAIAIPDWMREKLASRM